MGADPDDLPWRNGPEIVPLRSATDQTREGPVSALSGFGLSLFWGSLKIPNPRTTQDAR